MHHLHLAHTNESCTEFNLGKLNVKIKVSDVILFAVKVIYKTLKSEVVEFKSVKINEIIDLRKNSLHSNY